MHLYRHHGLASATRDLTGSACGRTGGPFAFRFRPLPALLGVFWGLALGPRLLAADQPAANPADVSTAGSAAAPGPSALVELINRLGQRGVLSKQDTAELQLLADADAAEARAQQAMLQAALAQAAAAQARARALAALAAGRRPAPPALPAPAPAAGPAADLPPAAEPAAPAVAVAPEPAAIPAAPAAAAPVVTPAASVPMAAAAPAAPPPAEPAVPDDTVRVTYVPEVVKQQLREEVKQDVLDEARKEGWATPQAVPGWITRFRLFGDVRTRFEGFRYPKGNDNTGSFPNFNAINTGSPFDSSQLSNPLFSPQLNVDQARNRFRLRARIGAEVDLGQSFSVGVRAATGESNSPVTENQSLGYAGSGQGGNFSKYSVWLDRAFLRYELGGLPDKDLTIDVGRFDNPFFATSVIWADDLGFDGAVARAKFALGEAVTPFLTIGAFPVFNTDLNYASNKPAKFKSNDKYLYAGQLGFDFDLGRDYALKLGAAYYAFQNIEGRLSTPFVPVNSSDPGDTDASRPAFAQKGNTYMALRDILPDPTYNGNGTTNLWQYYGLASKFQVMALDGRLDFNQFEPFQISLSGEYARNRAFDRTAIAAIAVNNRGTPTDAANPLSAPYVGGNTAWRVDLTLGSAALQKRWDWRLGLGYRKVESDAVVDGFCDSDFGGGGTNVKGVTVTGTLAFSRDVWLGLRWMSASAVTGPPLRNDVIQVDFNGRF